jgi:2,3-bisphosphoglycerate-independent phosphoglycerate mutase
MNLGAGRVVYQEITRIDKAIEDGDFFENEVLVNAVRGAKERGSKVHLIGLFSDGGVHASIEHLYALLELARRQGLAPDQVCVHAFTDGRDTDPRNGIKYAEEFAARASEIGVGRIVSIVGRYYSMDAIGDGIGPAQRIDASSMARARSSPPRVLRSRRTMPRTSPTSSSNPWS